VHPKQNFRPITDKRVWSTLKLHEHFFAMNLKTKGMCPGF